MTVYFKNVGYCNACWRAKCKGELTYEWLYRQVKRYCMSRALEFYYDKETGLGSVCAGLHTIGSFEVEK